MPRRFPVPDGPSRSRSNRFLAMLLLNFSLHLAFPWASLALECLLRSVPSPRFQNSAPPSISCRSRHFRAEESLLESNFFEFFFSRSTRPGLQASYRGEGRLSQIPWAQGLLRPTHGEP